MEPADPDNFTEIRCVGLPFTERRPLTEQEKVALLRTVNRMWWAGWLGGIGGPTVGFALFVSVLTLSNVPPAVAIPCVLSFYPALWLGMKGKDWRRRGCGLAKDLENGSLATFAGEAQMTPFDPAQKALIKGWRWQKPLLRLGEYQRIEVLPVSGRLWRINDAFVKPWISVVFPVPAKTPEIAHTAAQWLEPVPEYRGNDVSLKRGQRELTEEEKQEIQKFTRDFWRPSLAPMLILSAFISLILIAGLTDASEKRSDDRLLEVATIGALLLWCQIWFWRKVWSVRRLNQDGKGGVVVIVEITPKSESGEEILPTLEEYLPSSQTLWTENGKPSAWRVSTQVTDSL